MNCKKTGDMMMKYMEHLLAGDEALKFNLHLLDCKACRDDFSIYQAVMGEMDMQEETMCAPDDFVAGVMGKVYGAEALQSCLEDKLEGLLCFMWGITSLFAGMMAFILFSPKLVASYAWAGAAYGVYSRVCERALFYADWMATSVNGVLSELSVSFANGAEALKYVNLSIVVILVLTQFFMYKRVRVEV